MKRIIPFALVILLAGCTTAQQTQFQNGLTNANNFANKYGPLIGKDLILVANILVQAECSPALGTVSQTAVNILSIVAPNSSSAAKVGNALQINQQVANQLCPLYAALKVSVGTVPAGAPTQVIPATP